MLCTDCLKNEATISCKKINDGLCKRCRHRKGVMKFNYIPLKDLKEEKKKKTTDIEKIKQEVVDTLNNCYTEHNCNMQSEVHTEDIMITLVTLKELLSNSKELITETKNKLDIIEKYRRDINHEDEVEKKILTDDELAIYVSRKEHVLHNIRRELKDKLEIYELIDPICRTIKSNKILNLEQVTSVINKLTNKLEMQNSKTRSYTPYVDHEMIEKYDWCNGNTTKYVTKRKYADYKVTAFKTNLNKNIFNEKIEIVVNKCYSEEDAIINAKRKLGLDRPLIKGHNIFSNFKAERCNPE